MFVIFLALWCKIILLLVNMIKLALINLRHHSVTFRNVFAILIDYFMEQVYFRMMLMMIRK